VSDIQKLAEKLNELEMKVAFQDETIDTLSDVIAKQDKEIYKLWDANRVLKQSLNEIKSGNESDSPEPPPPHY
jgi:SlyX protein